MRVESNAGFNGTDMSMRLHVTSHGRRTSVTIDTPARGRTSIGCTHPLESLAYRRRSISPNKSPEFMNRYPGHCPSTRKVDFPGVGFTLQDPTQPSNHGNRRNSHVINIPSDLTLRRLSASVQSEPPSYRSGPVTSVKATRRSSLRPKGGYTVCRRISRNESVFSPTRETLDKECLRAKFRMAVKLTIFCARNFRDHCLRINAEQDDLAPFIKHLHFHDEETPDLLIDLSKFKANRQLRIPDEAKRILSTEVGQRSEQEIYSVTIALRNIKCIAEYPKRMQSKIAEVGLYEKYEAKRVIVRQGHPASAFYFLLSGAVVVMVMDEERMYARPVAHLYKGQTFGELAIINGTPRNSTVIAKETCEFLSISVQDYQKIFMTGGIKNITDPDQEVFLRSLSCLSTWPINIMKDHPKKWQFLFFKSNEVIMKDSRYSEWIVIIKSGSVQVLKKLKKVGAFGWKKKQPPEPLVGNDRREFMIRRSEWRRILPELEIPLKSGPDVEAVAMLDNGRPAPFVHPDKAATKGAITQPQVPNLWPFKVDLSEIAYSSYLEDERGRPVQREVPTITVDGEAGAADTVSPQLQRKQTSSRLHVDNRNRSNSVIQEEEKELLGFQPHIRTIMEDLHAGDIRQDEEKEADVNPEFVHIQTLTKGQVFGLSDLLMGDQPSFSVISKGADCLLINKQFYMEHASEKLLRDLQQEICPYPSEEQLQRGLQVSTDWDAYKKSAVQRTLQKVSLRRDMRTTTNGTKVQEAY